MSDAAIDTPRVRTRTRRRRLRASFNPASIVGLLVLLVFVAITLYPLVLVVSTALKDPLDVTLNPFALFSSFHPQNFRPRLKFSQLSFESQQAGPFFERSGVAGAHELTARDPIAVQGYKNFASS